MKILITNETIQYDYFIREKQSRRAFEFCKDVEIYLRTVIKDRLKDIDTKIRESIQSVIKEVFMAMETDVIDGKTFEEIFLSLL